MISPSKFQSAPGPEGREKDRRRTPAASPGPSFNPLPAFGAGRSEVVADNEAVGCLFQSAPGPEGREKRPRPPHVAEGVPVSIRSRPRRPGEGAAEGRGRQAEVVSIRSRPRRPGEGWPGRSTGPTRSCFNPLPAPKAGRSLVTGTGRPAVAGFNPLPATMVGRRSPWTTTEPAGDLFQSAPGLEGREKRSRAPASCRSSSFNLLPAPRAGRRAPRLDLVILAEPFQSAPDPEGREKAAAGPIDGPHSILFSIRSRPRRPGER